MSAAREPDQADFDLERFINLFDEAMTSRDPRVVETLRSLMMIVALTRPETSEPFTNRRGPLRRLFDDVNNLTNRIHRVEEELRDVRRPVQPYRWEAEDKYTMAAASNLAQSIDRDVMRELSKSTAMQINGGVWPKGRF
jgi:hypothetical protein